VLIAANPGLSIGNGQKLSLTATVKNGSPVSTYQWLLNNKAIAGATAATYTGHSFADNDEVTCKIMGECGNQPVYSSVVVSVSAESVTQISTVSDLKVVPNPNKGTFMLKGSLGTTMDEDITVEVTDVLGQVVFSDKFTAKNGDVNEQIQLTGATANGMYLLTMHSGVETRVFHVVVEQ
jgi:type IX secretion system substrate protein